MNIVVRSIVLFVIVTTSVFALDQTTLNTPPIVQGNCTKIAIDSVGSKFVAGKFSGNVDFNTGTGSNEKTAAGASSDLFLTKYNIDGSYAWTIVISGVSGENVDGICIVGDAIYLCGSSTNSTLSISSSSTAILNQIGTAGYGFVVAFNKTTGLPIETFGNKGFVQFGGSVAESFISIAASASNLFILSTLAGTDSKVNGTGSFGKDSNSGLAVISLDATTGSLKPGFGYSASGVQRLSGSASVTGKDISVDTTGTNVFIAGKYSSADFGIGVLNSSNNTKFTGSGAGFIASINASTGAANSSFGTAGLVTINSSDPSPTSGGVSMQALCATAGALFAVGHANAMAPMSFSISTSISTHQASTTLSFVYKLDLATGATISLSSVDPLIVATTSITFVLDATVIGDNLYLCGTAGTSSAVLAYNILSKSNLSSFGVGGVSTLAGNGTVRLEAIDKYSDKVVACGTTSASSVQLNSGSPTYDFTGFNGILLPLSTTGALGTLNNSPGAPDPQQPTDPGTTPGSSTPPTGPIVISAISNFKPTPFDIITISATNLDAGKDATVEFSNKKGSIDIVALEATSSELRVLVPLLPINNKLKGGKIFVRIKQDVRASELTKENKKLTSISVKSLPKPSLKSPGTLSNSLTTTLSDVEGSTQLNDAILKLVNDKVPLDLNLDGDGTPVTLKLKNVKQWDALHFAANRSRSINAASASAREEVTEAEKAAEKVQKEIDTTILIDEAGVVMDSARKKPEYADRVKKFFNELAVVKKVGELIDAGAKTLKDLKAKLTPKQAEIVDAANPDAIKASIPNTGAVKPYVEFIVRVSSASLLSEGSDSVQVTSAHATLPDKYSNPFVNSDGQPVSESSATVTLEKQFFIARDALGTLGKPSLISFAAKVGGGAGVKFKAYSISPTSTTYTLINGDPSTLGSFSYDKIDDTVSRIEVEATFIDPNKGEIVGEEKSVDLYLVLFDPKEFPNNATNGAYDVNGNLQTFGPGAGLVEIYDSTFYTGTYPATFTVKVTDYISPSGGQNVMLNGKVTFEVHLFNRSVYFDLTKDVPVTFVVEKTANGYRVLKK